MSNSGDFRSAINDLLSRVSHSAQSTTKYRDFEYLLATQLGIDQGDIYTAYISKAGNAAVRFSQSERARRARHLIALVDPPPSEAFSRSVDALLKAYIGHAVDDAEMLILSSGPNGWYVDSFVYTDSVLAPHLGPVANEYPGVKRIAMRSSRQKTSKARANQLRFIAIGPEDEIRGSFPLVVLRRDSWDDYHYRTTFGVEYFDAEGGRIPLGEVKILRRGQRDGQTPMPPGEFQSLGVEYCSLGQSYSYYESVKSLRPEVQRFFLRGLRDVVSNPKIRASFEDEPGFDTSLRRTGRATRALQDAVSLFTDKNAASLASGMRFAFHTDVGGEQFQIDFSFNQSADLPDRINAIIGYNGTGKTQLLSKIALIATGDLNQREQLSDSGIIENSESVRFGSVIAVSYSAFDTFVMPDAFWNQREAPLAHERLQRKGEVFGYTYCGLRRRAANDHQDTRAPRGLKSIDELTEEFSRALDLARQDDKRAVLLEALKIIGTEPSFGRTGLSDFRAREGTAWRQSFENLSTGHKIVLNIVTQVVGHSEPGSLVLLDEPESHLHPSLLAALLRAINVVLRRLDSFAIVATHSPVVLQEIPKRYVKILQRFGTKTSVVEPLTETFAENVGYLTTNVFHLDSTHTDYHAVLEMLAAKYPLEEIERIFDYEMSMQARAYVRSLQSRRPA
ncbi:AAA family ATPase [Actinoplanes auranticolor]|uniref:ATPase AAA-type core domain-containing protein n=1 Tax=Actinoplanes auranticolor TaxID=47988 RepID=A0A919VWQ3_9ACTN|nr:AAA family ATPase [Actinoplanes auranticolor]GIM78597.1 hypothetical protein Aau02nite_81640 [Actinoplanes auranticolor]